MSSLKKGLASVAAISLLALTTALPAFAQGRGAAPGGSQGHPNPPAVGNPTTGNPGLGNPTMGTPPFGQPTNRPDVDRGHSDTHPTPEASPLGKATGAPDTDRGRSEGKGKNDLPRPTEKPDVSPAATTAPGFGHGEGKAKGLHKHAFNGGKPFKATVKAVFDNTRVTVLLPNGTTQTFLVSGTVYAKLRAKIGQPVMVRAIDATHLTIVSI